MDENPGALFLKYSVDKLCQLGARVRECLGRLTGEQIWQRGCGNENAVGNLILHLCGNVRQWLVSGIGGAKDVRQRPQEFAERGPIAKAELLHRLEAAVAQLGSL